MGAISGEFGFKKAKMVLGCLLAWSITIAHDRKCPGIFTLFFWAKRREVSCKGLVVIDLLNLLRAISATESPHPMVSECACAENGTYPRFLLSICNLDLKMMLYKGNTFSTIPMVVKRGSESEWKVGVLVERIEIR